MPQPEANLLRMVGARPAKEKRQIKKERASRSVNRRHVIAFLSEVERQGWEMWFRCHGNGNGSWLGRAVAAAGVEQAAWELALWQRGLPAGGKTAGLPGRKR